MTQAGDSSAPMLTAFALALAQLTEPRVLRILAKSILATLATFIALGAAGWWGIERGLAIARLDAAHVSDAEGLRGLLAAVGVLIGGWLLWRIVALAVMQFFADEVIEAVEARHYPAMLVQARKLGWREELSNGLRGAMRALIANLIAIPVALALVVTGLGTALVFWLVNAVLLGRELQDMVWLRHRDTTSPLSAGQRFILGGIVAALLIIPFINLLAPFIGAAMATHLVHRKGTLPHAA
jgi:CysZ protein